MSEPDLLQLAGVQDDAKEQIMTSEEAKAKLKLFEELFAKGCYFCSKIIADEISGLDIDSVRGSALVCSRAYAYYQRILREKSEDEVGRINNLFMNYHFSYWSLSTNTKRKGIRDGAPINKENV